MSKPGPFNRGGVLVLLALAGAEPACTESDEKHAPGGRRSAGLERKADPSRQRAPRRGIDRAAEALPVPNGFPQGAARMLGRVLHDNRIYKVQHPPKYFDRFKDNQHPRATVVACADSRFHAGAIDHLPDDDLFMIRNIGNVVDTVGGSIEYGVRHLHTPLLMIVGHVRCGSVQAAMTDYERESSPIRREIDALHLSILRTRAQGSFNQRWLANVVGNVHQQVRYAMRTFARELTTGQLAVVGAVYDFRDDLKEGHGSLVVVNVNGDTQVDGSPMLQEALRHSQHPTGEAPAADAAADAGAPAPAPAADAGAR